MPDGAAVLLDGQGQIRFRGFCLGWPSVIFSPMKRTGRGAWPPWRFPGRNSPRLRREAGRTQDGPAARRRNADPGATGLPLSMGLQFRCGPPRPARKTGAARVLPTVNTEALSRHWAEISRQGGGRAKRPRHPHSRRRAQGLVGRLGRSPHHHPAATAALRPGPSKMSGKTCARMPSATTSGKTTRPSSMPTARHETRASPCPSASVASRQGAAVTL